MKLFKGKYGHSILCSNKKEGNEIKCYLNASFKKGTEPEGDVEGSLIFKDSNGIEHDCFFTCYQDKDGKANPKLMILPKEIGNHKTKYVDIKTEDLPFY